MYTILYKRSYFRQFHILSILLENTQNLDNGKPVENQGRKATGAKAQSAKPASYRKMGALYLHSFLGFLCNFPPPLRLNGGGVFIGFPPP